MAFLGIIRRWDPREQIPLREIARPANAERRSTRAIDKYAFPLSAFLKAEAAKSRKQRRTLKQIHEDRKGLGFEGSYNRVAAFARTWREGQSERVNPASKRTELRLKIVELNAIGKFADISVDSAGLLHVVAFEKW